MSEIETLLKDKLPHAYGVAILGITLTYKEETGVFELGDKKPCLECKKIGCNEKMMKVDSADNIITVVEYEDYLNQFKKQDYGKGRRCDYMMFDANDHKVVFCDLGCYSEKYVEKKRNKTYLQTSDSLKRFLHKPCGKDFIDKFNEKVLIFGRRNLDGCTKSVPKRGDAQGNMLSFMMTPMNTSKHDVSKDVVEGVEVSFIIVNYPNSYVW
jgi:hypothetical protein